MLIIKIYCCTHLYFQHPFYLFQQANTLMLRVQTHDSASLYGCCHVWAKQKARVSVCVICLIKLDMQSIGPTLQEMEAVPKKVELNDRCNHILMARVLLTSIRSVGISRLRSYFLSETFCSRQTIKMQIIDYYEEVKKEKKLNIQGVSVSGYQTSIYQESLSHACSYKILRHEGTKRRDVLAPPRSVQRSRTA